MGRLSTAIAFLTLAIWFGSVLAGSKPPDWNPARSPVGVLPPVDYSLGGAPDSVILWAVAREFERRAIPWVAPSELRPLLREHRIRSTGSLSRAQGETLSRVAGVAQVLFVTIGAYSQDPQSEVAVVLRIVDLASMEVRAAASAAAVGDDFARLFGVGRLDDPAALAGLIVSEAFTGLDWDAPRLRRSGPRVLVVPFDDSGDRPGAGALVAEIALSELWRAGYPIVEPGLAREVFLAKHLYPRGGIDRPTLEDVRTALGVDVVVTGEVQIFRSGQGAAETAAPELELGVRVIDARSGTLRLAYVRDETGPGIGPGLWRGRRGALAALAGETLREIVREIGHELSWPPATAPEGEDGAGTP